MNLFRRIRNVIVIAAIVGLVVASHVYLDDPLIVEYGDWRAAPKASVALAAAVLLYLLLSLLLRVLSPLFSLPSRLARWRKERAEQNRREMLEEGARAMARDEHKQALKSFSLLSTRADPNGVYAWLAAAAAAKAGDNNAREECLRRAADSAAADIAAAAKAELAAAEGREEESFKILQQAGAPEGSPLLAKMYLRAARRRQKWPQALAAAYRLQDGARAKKWSTAAREITETALSQMDDIGALQNFWKNNVAADDQKNAALLACYIRALHRLGGDKTLADTLERAVKTAADSPAVLFAAADFGADKVCETAFAAAEKREDKSDPEYLRAAAMLAARLKLWGRAKRYYQMANSLRPDPRNLRALDEIADKMRAEENAPEENFGRL